MNRIFLTDDQRALELLQKMRLPFAKLTAEAMPDLRGLEVVVIGKNGDAKKGALGLATRGVPEKCLSYVETASGVGLSNLLRNPKHLHWDDARSLAEVDGPDDFPVYQSGLGFLDPNLMWRFPELDVICGPYGSGKSLVGQVLAASFVATHGVSMDTGALLCSWEDLAIEMKRGITRHAIGAGLTPVDLLRRIHYVARDPSDDRLVDWYDNLVRYYHSRFNTKFFLLDPWNEIDHVRDIRQPETEYVREMMKRFRRLVNKLEIILIIVTHIGAKYISQNGSIEPFRVAQSFGSSQFGNKMDRGMCVVRTRAAGGDHTVIRFDKVKIERLMGHKGTVGMAYDDDAFTFRYDIGATNFARDIWKN